MQTLRFPPDLLNLNLHLDKIPRRFMCTFKSPRVTLHHSEGPPSFISPHAIGAPPMCKFSSVPFNCSVVSNSLQPHGLQQSSLSITNSPEVAQTHVHWVGDAIQPSHPLSSPSPPAFNLSQHQGLFLCARCWAKCCGPKVISYRSSQEDEYG